MSNIFGNINNASNYPPGSFIDHGKQSLITYEPHRVFTNSKILYDKEQNVLEVHGDLDVRGVIKGDVKSTTIDDNIIHNETTWSSHKIITKIRHTDMSQSFNFTNEHPRYGNDGFIGTQAARGFGFKPNRDMLITSLSLRRHETSNHSAIAIAIYSSDDNATAIELLGRSTQAIAESTGWWATQFDPPLKIHRNQYYVLMSASATGTPISRYSAIEHQNNSTIQQDYPVELIVPSSNEVYLYSEGAGFPTLPASHIGTSSTTPAFRIEGILANFELFNMINQDAISSITTMSIDDNNASTTSTWSSTKIQEELDNKPDINDESASNSSVWSSNYTSSMLFQVGEHFDNQIIPLQNEINKKAEIDDDETNINTTWSSTKIQNELSKINTNNIYDLLYLEGELYLPKANSDDNIDGSRVRQWPFIIGRSNVFKSTIGFYKDNIDDLEYRIDPQVDGYIQIFAVLNTGTLTGVHHIMQGTQVEDMNLDTLLYNLSSSWNTDGHVGNKLQLEINRTGSYTFSIKVSVKHPTITNFILWPDNRPKFNFVYNSSGSPLNRILGLNADVVDAVFYNDRTITYNFDLSKDIKGYDFKPDFFTHASHPIIDAINMDSDITGELITNQESIHRIKIHPFNDFYHNELVVPFKSFKQIPYLSFKVLEIINESDLPLNDVIIHIDHETKTNKRFKFELRDTLNNVISPMLKRSGDVIIRFKLKIKGEFE